MAYDGQRNALLAADRVASDLRRGRMAWISAKQSPVVVICIPSPRTTGGLFRLAADGTPDWQSWIVWWSMPNQQLPSLFDLRRQVIGGSFPPAGSFAPPDSILTRT